MDWLDDSPFPNAENTEKSNLITPDKIVEIRAKIKEQASMWLYGLDQAIDRRIDALFVLVPYSDKINRTKKLGQAHILFRGNTGIGKTDIEQSMALSVEAVQKRIQGNPELMPRHIIGGSKFVENLKGERRVVFEPGPLLAHLVLIDESNRTRQATLNAVVEAMEERSLTPPNEYIDEKDLVVKTLPFFPISGRYNDLESERFFQVALTQNPFGDEEGNYPTSQAILDRITLSINIDLPSFENEKKIRAENVVGKSIKPVTDLKELLDCSNYIFNNVRLTKPANDYLTLLLRNSRPPGTEEKGESVTGDSELVNFVKENIQVGASPRVNFHLEAVARVGAFFSGSEVIKPEHIKSVASQVIAHRLRLAPGVEFSSSKEEVFQKVLDLTEIPKWP